MPKWLDSFFTWLGNLDNVLDQVDRIRKLAGDSDKYTQEIWANLKGSGDDEIDNRHHQITKLKADRKEIIDKLNGSGGKGAKGLGQKVWASIARRLDFSNKTAHQDNLQEIDSEILRLEGLIQRRENLIHDIKEDERTKNIDLHIATMQEKQLALKKWNEEAARVQEIHQEELKKQRSINRKEEIISAQDEALKSLEHNHKLNRLRNNLADPDYKSPEDLTEELEIAKKKLELEQERNNLNDLLNPKQKPNPNQDLVDKIARGNLEVELWAIEARKSNAALLVQNEGKPEKSQHEIEAIKAKYTAIVGFMNSLLSERAQITKNQNYINNKLSMDRVSAIDTSFKEKWLELDQLIDRLS